MRRFAFGALIALLTASLTSCSNDSSPTGATPVPALPNQGHESVSPPAPHGDLTLEGLASRTTFDVLEEDFNCQDVDIARVRFGKPGFLRNNDVGLYVFFRGMPEGTKRVRVWWDYNGQGARFSDTRIEADVVEFESVLENTYDDVTETTWFTVRVELIVDGQRGNCARNRDVRIAPKIKSNVPAGPTLQTSYIGPTNKAPTSALSFFLTEGIRFTANTSLTLKSFKVYTAGTGTLKMNLKDSLGTVLQSTSVPITAGGEQRVNMGFNVAPGSYVLCLSGSTLSPPGVYRDGGGTVYPIVVPGVMSITDSALGFGGFFGHYYFFYDVEVTY